GRDVDHDQPLAHLAAAGQRPQEARSFFAVVFAVVDAHDRSPQRQKPTSRLPLFITLPGPCKSPRLEKRPRTLVPRLRLGTHGPEAPPPERACGPRPNPLPGREAEPRDLRFQAEPGNEGAARGSVSSPAAAGGRAPCRAGG